MTENEISKVAMIVLVFMIGAIVLGFILAATDKAEKNAATYVKVNDEHTFYQLVMYNSLIAYNCDDSVAAGQLDTDGDKEWDDWKTYRNGWETKTPGAADPPDNSPEFTMQNLNLSFPGPELNCYGTGTTVGGNFVGDTINPSSKEWRNDQEGKYSKIEFVVNQTPDSNPPADALEIGPCMWFDQPKDTATGVPPTDNGNPDAGWGNGGITDMIYLFTDSTQPNVYNKFDMDDPSSGCDVRYRFPYGGGSNMNNKRSGPYLTVTMIKDFSGNWKPNSPTSRQSPEINPRSPKIDGPVQIDIRNFHLCDGTRGYIQTNTGYTCDNSGGDGCPDDEGSPPYSATNTPGFPDVEYFQSQGDPKDNAMHTFVVITKYTC